MKKAAILLVVVAVGAGIFLTSKAATPAAQATAVENVETRSVALPEVGRASARGGPSSAAAADVADEVTQEEKAVLEMYDEILSALDAHREDCMAMGRAVEAAVAAGEADVKQFQAQAAARTPDQAEVAAQRFAAAAGARANDIRERLSKAMGTCTNELMPALQRLSSIEAGKRP